MLTIKIGAKELAAIVVFLLGLAVGAGRLLQRIDTLEQHDTYYHGEMPKEAK
jgi:hypothetical protein